MSAAADITFHKRQGLLVLITCPRPAGSKVLWLYWCDQQLLVCFLPFEPPLKRGVSFIVTFIRGTPDFIRWTEHTQATSKKQFVGREALVILLGLLPKTHTAVASPWLSSMGKAGDGGGLHNLFLKLVLSAWGRSWVSRICQSILKKWNERNWEWDTQTNLCDFQYEMWGLSGYLLWCVISQNRLFLWDVLSMAVIG